MTIPSMEFLLGLLLAISPAAAQIMFVYEGPLPAGSVGVSYSYHFRVRGLVTGPISFSVPSGTLPPGITLTTAGELTGTPLQAGTYRNLVITASCAGPPFPASSSNTYDLVITGPPVIRTTTLPKAVATAAYSTNLQGAEGMPPYTWWVTGGNFPSTLTLHPGTGDLYGNIQSTGQYTFTIEMRDNVDRRVSRQYTIAVLNGFNITSPPLLPGIENSSLEYGQTLSANGGTEPYTWFVQSGSLPPGFTLDSATGRIQGSNAPAGIYNFVALVRDVNNGTTSAPQSITIVRALSYSPSVSPYSPIVVGRPFALTFTPSGGAAPYTWSPNYATDATSGLPPGVNFTSGVFSGIPTTMGAYRPRFTLRDTGPYGYANYVWQILEAPVTIDVVAPLALTTSQNALTFTSEQGETPPATMLNISAAALVPIAAAVLEPSATWLAVSPNNATTPVALTVSVNPQGLSIGLHTATLRITSSPASNSPLDIPVQFRVLRVPRFTLSRSALRFAYLNETLITGPQSVALTFLDTPGVAWTAVSNQSNITVSPPSGMGGATLQVSARPGSSGTITVSAPGLSNPSQSIAVTVQPTLDSPPFGVFDTPLDHSTVSGATAVTGWALDNIEVTKVEVFREPVAGEQTGPGGLVYIGDAVSIPGTRPDVEGAFPMAPLNYRGGWGYHLLTNVLPSSNGSAGSGNGAYRLWAIAHDREGNTLRLGPKNIVVNNAAAVMPFGTIDLPAQGGTVSGTSHRNSGWVLTPPPCAMPPNLQGALIFIDGVPQVRRFLGSEFPEILQYNGYRQDVATLFPNYRNSNGSYAFWDFDTTRLANGIHTIAWSMVDDCGHREGIGSRFFFVLNSGASDAAIQHSLPTVRKGPTATRDEPDPTPRWRRGFDFDAPLELLMPGEEGAYVIEVNQMDRLELHLGVGAMIEQELPPGSSFENGVFSWLLGPGYLNEQQLQLRLSNGEPVRLRVLVRPRN